MHANGKIRPHPINFQGCCFYNFALVVCGTCEVSFPYKITKEKEKENLSYIR
jgi:aspartyl/asparaginyl beta-hydroxylase (cupin superfamily)